MNWWCILIPLIVGLICAILGYLLRKLTETENNNEEEIERLKTRIKQLESDLNSCTTKKTAIQADLDACLKNKQVLETDLSSGKSNLSNSIAASAVAPINLIPFDGAAAKAIFGKKIKQDDLKIVEGIGPKIEGLFHNFNIKTWKDLSETSIGKCQEVLNSGGERYKIHNPGTWPKQAQFAYEGKWEALLKWQDKLDGGKE